MKKILCVDDEQNVLDGFLRQLRKDFQITTSTGGEDALRIVTEQGPFAVIVSDMRMPGMDGIRFLARACEIAPDSVRIMLTGAGDLQTAVNAVNEGRIFRFLTKPCPAETLAMSLQAGLEQYRLVTAERELLEKTLKGSIKVLVDILAVANPEAFSRSMRIRHYTAQIAQLMNLPGLWQFEVAAMLSQIGCVTIPGETVEKAFAGEKLSPTEQEMFTAHPQVGGQFIANIPRLETVASMIARQQEVVVDKVAYAADDQGSIALLGAQILKVAVDFDLLLTRGVAPEDATAVLTQKPDVYAPHITHILHQVKVPSVEKATRVVKTDELRNGMILAEEIRTTGGVLVVSKGQEVGDTLRQRLKNFAVQGTIPNSIRVTVFKRTVTEAL